MEGRRRFVAVVAAVVAVAAPAVGAGLCPALPPPGGPVVAVASVAELEAAVAALAAGETISVADGTYDLTQTLRIRNGVTGVAIRGAGGDRDAVVIRGRGMSNAAFGNVPHVVLIEDAADVLLADLTLRDAYFHNVQIKGELGAAGVRLERLRLVDAGEQQVKGSTSGAPGPYPDFGTVACSVIEYTDRARSDYTNGVDVLAGAGWVIRDNLFRNIRAPIGSLAGPAILMWRNCLDTVVERNLFIECDRGIALGLSAPDANSRDGETTYDHQGGVIRNNIIYRAAGAATGDVGITVNYSRDYAIHHNTVILNGTFPWAIEYRFAASSGALSYNLTDGPVFLRDGAAGILTGNLTGAQPSWFVDAANADLHLDPGSPAVDQATPPEASVGDDFDGAPRPAGAAPDVGADEVGCGLPAAPLSALTATRDVGDVLLQWGAGPAPEYNLWYANAPAEIDNARLGDPLANGVAGCSPPTPALTTACRDAGAVARAPDRFFYQVRAACAGAEGP